MENRNIEFEQPYINIKLDGLYIEHVKINEPLEDIASHFANLDGTTLLLCGGKKIDSARYNILGIKPWLEIKSKGKKIDIVENGGKKSFHVDPFEVLRKILANFKFDYSDLPITSGLLGYFSYDLKDLIEKLPKTSVNDTNLPDICLYSHKILVVSDRKKEESFICIPKLAGCDEQKPAKIISEFYDMLKKPKNPDNDFAIHEKGFNSLFTKEEYIDAILRIKEYIIAGDIYQANMSQRFEAEFTGSPYALFTALYKKNPAPFFAYINAGDHHIVSTSPERFILRRKEYIETRPIKGTRPRGKNKTEDDDMKKKLCESKKDDAELSMIVDLLRNDIGKVCKEGSVRVTDHKRLETYDNVFHLVSDITGILAEKKDSVDLLKAIFPGGSITGCPKIRSMEIIDELEPVRRHIYTGSIGYISFHDTLDLSIAIRTATITNDKIFFSAGGGIVFDSDPDEEYFETLHKGKTFFDVFENKKKEKGKCNFLWKNGKIELESSAFVSATDKGFLYGYGFFETIKAENGKPLYLKEHIDRFERTWKALLTDEKPVPDIDWDKVIEQILIKNSLSECNAAVKILASEKSLFVYAKEYIHRFSGRKEKGLNILTYPYPRETNLADYKTLNYLYYLLAGEWAMKNGADEALITNPDGSISETNSANILAIFDKKVVKPLSDHSLPGIMQQAMCDNFLDSGYKIETKKLYKEDLFEADQVLLTNSLIGAVSVYNINGIRLRKNSQQRELRRVRIKQTSQAQRDKSPKEPANSYN